MTFLKCTKSNNSCNDAKKFASLASCAKKSSNASQVFNSNIFADTAFAVSVLLYAFIAIIGLFAISLIGIFAILIALIILTEMQGKQNERFAAVN